MIIMMCVYLSSITRAKFETPRIRTQIVLKGFSSSLDDEENSLHSERIFLKELGCDERQRSIECI